MTYQSDERGFRNPAGAWNPDSTLDVAMIGDSYAMGVCQPDSSTIAAGLRERWSRTLNLGVPGAGPLMELGTLKEYAAPLEPRTVLWFIYEGNDLADLAEEMVHPLLPRYLEPGFTQGLERDQAKIDSFVLTYLRTQLETAERSSRERASAAQRTARLLAFVGATARLPNVRTLLGLTGVTASPEAAVVDLERVLREAGRVVNEWAGELIVVYLPTSRRYADPSRAGLLRRDEILAAVNRVGLPVIDLVPEFARVDRPDTLWVYPNSHYTADGFRFVREFVVDELAKQRQARSEPLAVAPPSSAPTDSM